MNEEDKIDGIRSCIVVDITSNELGQEDIFIDDEEDTDNYWSRSAFKIQTNTNINKDMQCPICFATLDEIKAEESDQKSVVVMCPYSRNDQFVLTHGLCLPCALTLYFDAFHDRHSTRALVKCPICRQYMNTLNIASLVRVPSQLKVRSLLKDMMVLLCINIPTQLLISRSLTNRWKTPKTLRRLNLHKFIPIQYLKDSTLVDDYSRLGGAIPFHIAFGYIGYAFGNSLSMTLFSLITQRIRELLTYQASDLRFQYLTGVPNGNDMLHSNISSSLFFLIIGLCLFPSMMLHKIVKPSISPGPQFIMDIACALCLGLSHQYVTYSLSNYNPNIRITAAENHSQNLMNSSSLAKYPLLVSKIRNAFVLRRGFVLRFLSSTLCMIGRLIALFLLQKRWYSLSPSSSTPSSFSLGILTAYMQTLFKGVTMVLNL